MSTRVLGGICTHSEGCSKYYNGRGLCRRHYAEYRRSAEFEPGQHRTPQDVPPVCVCDVPLNVTAFGECQRCRRPYRQETFADLRAAWRAHLGMDVQIAASHPRGNGEVGPAPDLPVFAK